MVLTVGIRLNFWFEDNTNLFWVEYLSEDGQTSVLPLVGKTKQQMSTDPTLCPEYASSLGQTEFTRRATDLALGKNSHAVMENRVVVHP